MDNAILEDIKNYAYQKFMDAYGYCGVAEGKQVAMLNSGGEGDNLIVQIQDKKD